MKSEGGVVEVVNCNNSLLSVVVKGALVLLVLFGLYRTVRAGYESFGVDYYQFWGLAHSGAEGRLGFLDEGPYRTKPLNKYFSEYYVNSESAKFGELLKTAAQNRKVVDLTGTPFFYAIIYLLSAKDYDFSLGLFQLLSGLLFCFAIFQFCKFLNLGRSHLLAVLIYLLFFCEPLASDLRVTNVNQFQLGVLGAYLWLLSRKNELLSSFASMMLLTLLTVFKPNIAIGLLLVVALRFFQGDFKRMRLEILGFLAALPIGFFAHFLFIANGPSWGRFFISHHFLLTNGRFSKIISQGNFSPVTFISYWSGANYSLLFIMGGVIFASILGLFCLFVWQFRKRYSFNCSDSIEQQSILALGSGAALFLLLSPLAWIHYYLLLLPLCLYLIQPAQSLIFSSNMQKLAYSAVLIGAIFILSLESFAMYFTQLTDVKVVFYVNWLIIAKAIAVAALLSLGAYSWLSRLTLNRLID